MEAISTERIDSSNGGNPDNGRVVWDSGKSAWLSAMTITAVLAGPATLSWDALLVFIGLTALTIIAGHSVGMHRMLIHKAFRAPKWLERLLVYLGTLVSMEGPMGMIRLHDHRDWGQRQATCHDFFSHRAGFWRDAWWQLHCRFEYRQPPILRIEPQIAEDPVHRFLQATWHWQQLPLALVLYALGGIGWIVWGIAVRISVSLIGHWLIGYLAHQPRDQRIHVKGMGVQGYNVPGLGLLTAGESYHENHHAFPNSAKLSIWPGQLDPGWWLISTLHKLRLVSEVRTPLNVPERAELKWFQESN